MSIVINGTGTITGINAGGLNDAIIQQADLATGVAGTGPAFSAWKSNSSGTQSITTGVYTKVTFDSEDYDTANCFSSSRFTPNVAGYYQINAEVDIGNATGIIFCGIFKNGSEIKRGSGTSSGTETYTNVSSIIYMNGSTDYLEIYGIATGGATPQVYATTAGQYTYFNGVLVRAA